MNLLDFLDELGQADSTGSLERRSSLLRLSRVAAAALPFALAGVATPARAQRIGTLLDLVKLALQLARLQQALYGRARTAPGLADLHSAIEPLYVHETQHVTRLEKVVLDSGGELPTTVNYDFTGSRNGADPAIFPADVFTNRATFLSVAQTVEDACVRAGKTLLPLLMSDNDLMRLAVSMQAVQARHSAYVRRLRGQKAWVSQVEGNGPVPGKTDFAYAGEDRVKQPLTATSEQNITELTGYGTPDKLAPITQAFDEPLGISAEALLAKFTY
ncbi:ferritin-like domain-containing protein [Hymenobacter sp. B81]|uniref:ferritin-like domain-containing protein n=1 Tax=Hymenobacter sp. B81 TaxID=3344878 RepID=UPI0037DDE2A4